MRVVVVGDIARPNFYHVGDEAMAEVAIDQLRAHGVHDIVLVGQDPELATRTYGCPAVPRFTFADSWSRERCDRELAALDERLASGLPAADGQQSVIDAVAQADALLISGGGNLRSRHRYMIYERVALVRAAKHYGTPVFVTSQTVGPVLEEPDEALVREIVDSATCFGVREPSTERLIRGLAGEQGRIVRTMDDAVLLDPRPADAEALASLEVPHRYLVASFTYHAGVTGLPTVDYRRYLAGLLDRLADHLDADVLLVPHAGSFDLEQVSHDRANDAGILRESRSGRLRALPMLTARHVVALTAGAMLSVSTRYHPTVFASSQAVPSLALVTSHYSSIRMVGSLANVGLGQFALPADPWSDQFLLEAVDAALDPGVREHLRQAGQLRRAEQSAWWDALIAAIEGRGWNPPSPLTPVTPFPRGAWAQQVSDELALADQKWREREERPRTESKPAPAPSPPAPSPPAPRPPVKAAVPPRNPVIRLAGRARRLARNLVRATNS